jgi:alpha-L-fucosidase
MTMNDSWGYQRADDNWKSAKTAIRNLSACANGGGNYLLNIGPKPDGSIPEESVRILSAVGQWMDRNGATIYDSEPCQASNSVFANFTRKGNTLYIHVYFWPGGTVAIGGLQAKVVSARLLASGQKVEFEQERFRVRFKGLPATAPDEPVTVIAAECDAEPTQNMDLIRTQRPRTTV